MSLLNRTLLVTGASRGIGRAITEKLLNDGHQVVGLARHFEPDLSGNKRFHPLEIDLADLDNLPARLIEIGKRFPDLDGIICCAGVGRFGSLEQFSYRQIRSLIDLNFTSQAIVTRALLPQLKKQTQSNIVFIGSEAALAGSRKGTIYCASKFALRGFAQALRDESAKSGVAVSIVNPGMTRTGFFNELDFEPGDAPENHLLPEEIADTVALIMSSRAGCVVDEINLSPQNKVIQFKNRNPD